LKSTGHRDLRVWQDAMALVRVIYTVNRRFPADEQFGLNSQSRQAAVSVPSNIAGGGCAHKQASSRSSFLSPEVLSKKWKCRCSLRKIWDIWCKKMTFSPLFLVFCAQTLRS
jgi:23S rRNA-intervening sequence protein